MLWIPGFSFLVLSVILLYRWFHRIPERTAPLDFNAVIAPADGIVWQIVPLLDSGFPVSIPKRFLGKIRTLTKEIEFPAYLVSIFMRPWDSHVNWSPMAGKAIAVKHSFGKFSFANSWESLENEKNEIVIQGERCKIKLIQIAGFLARRIDCWISEGENIVKGKKIGMIRLGSQVSLILPKQIDLCVRKGDKVKGGETILGRWKE